MSKGADYLNRVVLPKILDILIKIYQSISKYFPSRCRFYPSCSEYMRIAVYKKGFFIGFFLGIKRILKCHPFSDGGYDPVE